VLIVAVKVAIIVAVLALPSWLAISLGAAHGVALVLVALAALGLLVAGAVRRRNQRRHPRPVDRPHPGEMTMLTTESRIETANASSLLTHLCRHAAKMGGHLRHGPMHGARMHGAHARPDVLGVEYSDTHGTLDLSWGRCVLDATPDALTVRVEAANEEHLRGIQSIITADLERFGHRDNLTLNWSSPAAHVDEPGKGVSRAADT
jgi:hypothetical protein